MKHLRRSLKYLIQISLLFIVIIGGLMLSGMVSKDVAVAFRYGWTSIAWIAGLFVVMSFAYPFFGYGKRNIHITGDPAELWPRIEPILSSGVLVAHNAPFDLGVLKKCLRGYGIEWRPQVPGLCTVRMGRRLLPGISHRLDDMCAYYGIDLDHHRADSDSLACARILIRYMESGAAPEKYLRTYPME